MIRNIPSIFSRWLKKLNMSSLSFQKDWPQKNKGSGCLGASFQFLIAEKWSQRREKSCKGNDPIVFGWEFALSSLSFQVFWKQWTTGWMLFCPCHWGCLLFFMYFLIWISERMMKELSWSKARVDFWLMQSVWSVSGLCMLLQERILLIPNPVFWLHCPFLWFLIPCVCLCTAAWMNEWQRYLWFNSEIHRLFFSCVL